MDTSDIREVVEMYNRWKLTVKDTSMEAFLLDMQMQGIVESVMRLEYHLKTLGEETIKVQEVVDMLGLTLSPEES